MDMNRDGKFSANELKRILEYGNYFIEEKQCELLIQKLDKTKDGRVTF